MNQFAQHQKERNLVSIERAEIDDNSIQGFVLASSKELVVLQYVYDFNLDGLMVLRVADITDLRCTTTEIFQKTLLEEENLLGKVPFDTAFDLQDWRSLISQLSREYQLMILERERPDDRDLFIGKILELSSTGVQGQYFSGAANWEDLPTELAYRDITSCQVASNYIKMYERHFERKAQLKNDV